MMRQFIVEGWFLLIVGLGWLITLTALIWTMHDNKVLQRENEWKVDGNKYAPTEGGFIGGLLLLILGIAFFTAALLFYGVSQLW